jgi:hypothetical protein
VTVERAVVTVTVTGTHCSDPEDDPGTMFPELPDAAAEGDAEASETVIYWVLVLVPVMVVVISADGETLASTPVVTPAAEDVA